MFDGDEVSLKLRNVANECPPNLTPDAAFESEGFSAARQACNAEMMTRCLALCTAKTRKNATRNIDDYVPYILRAVARRNLQKIIGLVPLEADSNVFAIFLTWLSKHSPYDSVFEKGVDKRNALPQMILKIADSIADPGQAALEAPLAANQLPLLADESTIREMASALPRRSANTAPASALEITLAELKACNGPSLHSGSIKKSTSWALDQYTMEDSIQHTDKKKFEAYRKSLEKLLSPGKGSKRPPSAVLSAFKSTCTSLGIEFDEKRLGDLAKLFAALKAQGRAFEQ